ncbi:UNVERIFIED_ORG: hypothetical protein QE446_005079 [Rhizobium sp. SORGH_AS260]|nr:hypothetical protein [Agrobacterium sp. RC10-4-1]MDP9734937.1 hypothetical protein [Rhizobium sp. SORGH_AS_0285]MDP9757155.1 hypothetical protein [Rhizobium sp. SORGH_AS_0260]MDR6084106.1 hypothetical protein [Agrobacterium sp. SORGH_AS_0440]
MPSPFRSRNRFLRNVVGAAEDPLFSVGYCVLTEWLDRFECVDGVETGGR